MSSQCWRRVLILLVLMGGWGPSGVQGQDKIPFRRFTTHEGLPHESITTIDQTTVGQLWVGTRTGLAVYDGSHFETIPLPDSLRGGGVVDVQPMPDGSVWVTMRDWHGIVQIRHRRVVRTATVPTGAKVNRLLARDDTLIATSTQAVWTRPPGGLHFRKRTLPYDVKPGAMLSAHPASGAGIADAALAADGTLWILDGRFGPGRLRPDGSVEFVSLATSPDQLWTTMRVYEDGRVLLTRRGSHELVAYDPASGAKQVLVRDLEGANYVELAGHTAYVTDARGLRRVDLRTGTRRPSLDAALGLPDAYPTSVYRDRSASLWIGTRNGLLQLHAPTVRHIRSVGEEKVTYANRFKTAVDGELWLQTYGSGLVQVRPTRRSVTPDGRAEWGQGVRSVEGALHALAHGHWYKYDLDTGWKRIGATGGAVRGYVGQNGIGYFWHDDGIYRHDPSAPASPQVLYQWAPNDRALYQIARTRDGRLFVRARDVLLRLRPEPSGPVRVDTVAHLPGLADVGGRYMTATPEGEVWIVAPNRPRRGLLHVNVDEKPPHPHLHLKGKSVYNVSVNGDSLVLASSRSGLYLLDAQKGTLRRHLTRNDGLLSTFARGAAIHKDSLYVSHSGGLTVFPLREALRQPSVPQTAIMGLRVNHEPHSLRPSMSLDASERTLDINYAAPHLRNPEQVTFEYRLLPDDTTWHATDRPTRQFSALGRGRHRFEVRARIGETRGSPASLVFTVAPFYYETWWFRGLCAVGLLGVMTLAYRWRVEHLRRRKAVLEKTVAERTRALRAKKEESDKKAERLATLDTAKNRFFANLSHEFRTPLTLIIAPLRSVLREFDHIDSISERLRPVLRNARRLEHLINQLLDLSKFSAGEMELQPQPVDLVARAQEMHEAFVPLAERQNLSLQFRADVETLPASVDPTKIDKILSNLLSNALKFTESGGTVWLAVSRSEARAHLVVKDTGVGIPEDDLEGIFERFQQVDGSTTRSQEGTGIGLALTRDLVELHNGSIGVESEPGIGTAFTVRLPLGEALTKEAVRTGEQCSDFAPPPSASPSLPSTSTDGRAPSDAPGVLAVDDNPDVRAFLQRGLGTRFRVETAATGEEALSRMRSSPPDIVVSDVMMPDMDGFALCEAIKSDEDLHTIPVLLVTARADAEATIDGLRHGADDYVTKPFDIRELSERIGRLVEMRETLRSEYGKTVHIEEASLQVAEEDRAFVESVLTVIHESIDDPDLTVDRLADAVALSRRQLTRRLRETIDEPPAALIRRLRLEQAASRLDAPDSPRISDLAYAVGFRTASHFSKAFKKHFGCPPSQYPDES